MGMIRDIHAKNPDNAIDRVAKCIGTVHEVCEMLERENHAVDTSAVHNKQSFTKDLDLIVEELDEQRVFLEQGCQPRCYRDIKNVLQLTSKKKLKEWIPKKVKITSYNLIIVVHEFICIFYLHNSQLQHDLQISLHLHFIRSSLST